MPARRIDDIKPRDAALAHHVFAKSIVKSRILETFEIGSIPKFQI